MRSRSWLLQLFLVAVLLALPISSRGQGVEGASDPNAVVIPSVVVPTVRDDRTYGTAKTFLTLSAWNFHPIDSTVTYAFNNTAIGQTINRTGGSSIYFKAPLQLPDGVLVTEVEFVVCDTNAVSNFSSNLFIQPRMAGASVRALVSTSGTPGCVDLTAILNPAVQIDNNANSYQVEVNLPVADATLQLASARVGYFLQISPAPVSATFTDVPTSDAGFRFIEALVAAGITSGCNASPLMYCPDDFVTRRQMAVFISRGLGLQFAP